MSIESMYKLVRGENTVWGVEGYEVSKVYEDPMKIIAEKGRLALLKSGCYKYNILGTTKKIDKSKLPKKSHFLDDLAKQTKGFPGP